MIIIFKKVRDSLTTRLVPDYFYLYIHEQSPSGGVEDRQAVERSRAPAKKTRGKGSCVASARASRMAKANDDCLKIYTYKWEPAQPAGIENISISHNADNCYSIDGRKLSGKPAQKGIYIVNGRKVAVK